MNNRVNSELALEDCLSHFGMPGHAQVSYDAKCQVEASGSKGFTSFRYKTKRHSEPSLVFDVTLKGFGIPYTEFSPQYQLFEYDECNQSLKIRDRQGRYEFVVSGFEKTGEI